MSAITLISNLEQKIDHAYFRGRVKSINHNLDLTRTIIKNHSELGLSYAIQPALERAYLMLKSVNSHEIVNGAYSKELKQLDAYMKQEFGIFHYS